MVSFLERIKYITDNFGPRIAGSEGDKQAIEYLEKEFNKFTPNVETESFKVVGNSPQLYISFIVLGYFTSAICYFLLPPLSLGLSLLVLAAHILFIFRGISLIDFFAKKKETKNIIGTLPSEKESRGIIILSGHHDSSYEMPISLKVLKYIAQIFYLIISSVGLLFISGIWKIIICAGLVDGLLFLFDYSLGSLTIRWFLLPDIFFFLSIICLPLAFYVLKSMVTKTEVMGANDNLTAVVLLITLGEYLKDEPLENWEVRLISFGAEETIKAPGSRLYVKNHLKELDNAVVLNLEMLGVGDNFYLSAAEKFYFINHDEEYISLVQKIAKKNNIELPAFKQPFGWTDACHFSRNNIKATTISYYGKYGFWHSIEDKVENLEEEPMQNAFDFIKILLKELDSLEKI